MYKETYRSLTNYVKSKLNDEEKRCYDRLCEVFKSCFTWDEWQKVKILRDVDWREEGRKLRQSYPVDLHSFVDWTRMAEYESDWVEVPLDGYTLYLDIDAFGADDNEYN